MAANVKILISLFFALSEAKIEYFHMCGDMNFPRWEKSVYFTEV